jgi:hypothetical protein
MWHEHDVLCHLQNMTSSATPSGQYLVGQGQGQIVSRENRKPGGIDYQLIDDVKHKIVRRGGNNLDLIESFFKELEEDFQDNSAGLKESSSRRLGPATGTSSLNYQRASTASTASSVDTFTPSYPRLRDKITGKNPHSFQMSGLRDHDAIPEESQEEYRSDRTNINSYDYDVTTGSGIPRTLTDHVSQLSTMADHRQHRGWQEAHYSYSDNEKQLIEEMKQMKKDHQQVLQSYEQRIGKLMAKMHELRNIAEMLENSSTKSSPYGILPGKAGLLTLLGRYLCLPVNSFIV